MRILITFVLLLALAYVLYQWSPWAGEPLFPALDEPIRALRVLPAATQAKGRQDAEQSRISVALQNASTSVFGPLRRKQTGYSSAPTSPAQVLAEAVSAQQNQTVSRAEQQQIQVIVGLLREGLAARNRHEQSYQEIAAKNMTTLFADQKKKQEFFLDEQERQWARYVDGMRPRVERELAQLKRLESR